MPPKFAALLQPRESLIASQGQPIWLCTLKVV